MQWMRIVFAYHQKSRKNSIGGVYIVKRTTAIMKKTLISKL